MTWYFAKLETFSFLTSALNFDTLKNLSGKINLKKIINTQNFLTCQLNRLIL